MIKASVIIPTYNRGKLLCNTLKYLIEHIPADTEIIVVDQSDEVHKELAEIVKNHCNLVHYFKICKKGLPHARNYGLRQALGEIVIFCDDDVIPVRNYIQNHLKNYDGEGIGGVGGRIIPQKKHRFSFPDILHRKLNLCSGAGKTGVIRRWDAHLIDNFDATAKTYIDHLQGCNMSFLKKALIQAGSFDENFGGSAHLEETDACLRIRKAGYKIVFDPNAELTHLKDARGGCRAESYREWFYWYGHNNMLFFLKNFRHGLFPLFAISSLIQTLLSACKRCNPMVIAWAFSGYRAGLKTYKSSPSP
jgi:GT2 family glycosyltransferase